MEETKIWNDNLVPHSLRKELTDYYIKPLEIFIFIGAFASFVVILTISEINKGNFEYTTGSIVIVLFCLIYFLIPIVYMFLFYKKTCKLKDYYNRYFKGEEAKNRREHYFRDMNKFVAKRLVICFFVPLLIKSFIDICIPSSNDQIGAYSFFVMLFLPLFAISSDKEIRIIDFVASLDENIHRELQNKGYLSKKKR